MIKMNYVLFSLCLATTTALANLNVIADIGGEDASPYFAGINRQDELVVSHEVPPVPLSQSEAEAALLPVTTPELTPGEVVARPLQLPGLGALFIVGDDGVRSEEGKYPTLSLFFRPSEPKNPSSAQGIIAVDDFLNPFNIHEG